MIGVFFFDYILDSVLSFKKILHNFEPNFNFKDYGKTTYSCF